MKIVILCGGTGKRFWPLSRKKSPKQFLPIIDNKPLVRLKLEYLRLGFSPKDIYVSTGIQYKNEVYKLLPEIPRDNFIFEPEMKDTGPAIALASFLLEKKFPDEVISFQWSDHYIKDPTIFVETLKKSENIVLQYNKSVVVGAYARFASEQRGHIKFGKELKKLDLAGKIVLNEFEKFVEKPSLDVAREYLKTKQYSWNTGYYVSTAKLILSKYQQFAPETYNTIKRIADDSFSKRSLAEFSKVERKSFDYIFGENLTPRDTIVINSEMGWSDVGEWVSLKEALEKNKEDVVSIGNTVDIDSKDSIVFNNEIGKLVATVNVSGLAIINTKDVVAIFPKDDNMKLKDLIKLIEEKKLEKYL
jgi:mannose-1-phosphate guanylyltransferase